jgi:membrane fusion protein, protease secretion system
MLTVKKMLPSIASPLIIRFHRWADSLNPYQPDRLAPSDCIPVVLEESVIRKTMFRWVFFALSAFLVWACFAPLDNGVLMQGSVVVEGNRKAVQHLQGGVVTHLMVHEDQQVEQGQVLMRLNPLVTEASLEQTEAEYINLMVNESRLVSERLGLSFIRWIDELKHYDRNDFRIEQEKNLQIKLFDSRRQELQNQQHVLQEQIQTAEKQQTDLSEVLDLKKQQLALVSQEANNNRELAKEGYVSVAKANEIERMRSDLLAAITNLRTEMTRTQSTISAHKLQLLQLRTTFLKEVDTRLSEVQKNRRAIKPKVDALSFDKSLTEIKAPISGTVVGLKVFTEGGVVRAGEVLLEIVPQDGQLIVQANVPPQYIDKVRSGLTVFTRFTAFNMNTTPVIDGEITMVGDDKLTTQQGEEYYLAHIKILEEQYAKLGQIKIQPGMPVEVVAKTGERTFMSYLLKPLTDRMARSFKDPF